MNTSQQGSIEGVVTSSVLILARGFDTWNIPRDELKDLQKVLNELTGDEVSSKQRRGELWKKVQKFLGSTERAQGFRAVLNAVGGDAGWTLSSGKKINELRLIIDSAHYPNTARA